MIRIKVVCIVLLVILVPIVALLALPFTSVGTQFLVAKVNQYTPLQIRYGSGSFASDLKLNSLVFSQDGVSVDLRDVNLGLGLPCLWVSKICIDLLKVESLRVDLLDTSTVSKNAELDERVNSDSSETAQFEFPVVLEIPSLNIRSLEIHWASGRLVSGPVSGAAIASDTLLSLVGWKTSDTALHLLGSADSEPVSQALELPELNLPFELVVTDLALESPLWSVDQVRHQHEGIQLGLSWIENTIAIKNLRVSSEDWGVLSLIGTIEAVDEWQLDIEANAALMEPPLNSWLHDRTVKLTAQGKLNALQFAAQMAGDQALTLAGLVNVIDAGMPFAIELTGQWADPWGLAEIVGGGAEVPDLNLLSPWTASVAGSLDQQTLSLSGSAEGYGYRQLELSIAARHDQGDVQVNSLSLFDQLTDSRIDLSGAVSVADGIRWDLDIQSTGFDFPVIPDIPSGRLQGQFDAIGHASDGGWLVQFDQLDLRGRVDGGDAGANGKLSFNSELELFDTQLKVHAADATLAIAASQQQAPELDLQIPKVGRWLESARGSLALVATMDDDQRHLAFNGSARKLAVGELTAPIVSIEGELDLRSSDQLNLQLSAAQLDYQQAQLRDINASVLSSGGQHELSLSVAGDIATDLKLSGGFSGAVWSGQLDPTAIITPFGAWTLEDAVAVRWQKATSEGSIAAHCWNHDEASLCLRDLQKSTTYTGVIDLNGDLRILAALAPENTSVSGDTAALLEFSMDPQTGLGLTVEATVQEGGIRRVVAGKESVFEWDKIEGQGKLDADKARVDLKFRRDEREQLSIDLSAPRRGDENLDGQFLFDQLNLGSLVASFIPGVVDPQGVLDGELLLSGTGDAPLLNGAVTLSNGQFSLEQNPTLFEAISANITATGDRANLRGSALVGSGQTEISGYFVWVQEPNLDLTVRGQGQTVLLPPGLEANISEDLRLQVSKGSVEVTGEITVHEGALEHEHLPAGSVDVSADVVEVDYEGKVIRDEEGIDLIADLKLNLLDAFAVIGPGLTTTVGGELELKKQSAQPLQLFGELNIIDGQVEALGQVLDIKKGSLSFVGSPENPDLNIRAQREIAAEKIQVGLEILGSLEDFSFNVYSTPALPESEAMSYLIRGRGLDQGAQVDGTALALSLGLGAVNKIGLFEGLNKLPGLNNISFGTDGEAGDTTATVSAYLGERLYLAYGIGVYEPLNVLTARLYLQTQLWLEVVSSLVSSADVYYSVEIE
ncbi:MAG: translocation/assembly module TamB domain-containing protein [Halioglobus sp.]